MQEGIEQNALELLHAIREHHPDLYAGAWVNPYTAAQVCIAPPRLARTAGEGIPLQLTLSYLCTPPQTGVAPQRREKRVLRGCNARACDRGLRESGWGKAKVGAPYGGACAGTPTLFLKPVRPAPGVPSDLLPENWSSYY